MNNLETILNDFAEAFKLAVLYYCTVYKNVKVNKDTLSNSDIVNKMKIQVEDDKLSISIFNYYSYIESGRKVGAKLIPLKNIIEWIKAKKIQGRNKKGQFISVNSLAWAIVKSIQNKGISPRPIFSKAYDEVSKEFDKKLNVYVNSIVDSILIKITIK